MRDDHGRWAKVVAVYPSGHSVDIVYLDTGARVPKVPVLSARCSTNTGLMDLPTPTAPAKAYSSVATKDRDVWAAVVSFGGIPVVIGFKVPELCQMTFAEPDLKIDRHSSDVYTLTDSNGNWELYHPSGTYLSIGTGTAHRDLTGTDFDKLWKITKNTSAAVHVHLSVRNAGVEKASLDIAPTGNIAVVTSGDLSATVSGNAALAVTGNITSSAATWNHTGDVNVTGTVTATTDVIGGGKHLKTHTHGGVTTGGGTTGAPT